MSTGKRAAKFGVAAFALGVFLAGPQAGSAAADTSEGASPADAADSDTGSAKASAPTHGRSQAPSAGRSNGTARGAGRVVKPVEAAAPVEIPAKAAPAEDATAVEASLPVEAVTPVVAVEVAAETPAAVAEVTAATAAPVAVAPPARTPRPAATVESRVPVRAADATPADPDSALPGPAVDGPSVLDTTVDAAPVVVDQALSPVAVDDGPAEPIALTTATPTYVTPGDAGLSSAGSVIKIPPFNNTGASTGAERLMLGAAQPLANLHSEVQGFFIKVKHFLADLQLQGGPLGQVAVNLEGLLAIVRRTFFNQAPTLNPLQRSITQSGLVVGTVGGYDAEGDALTYSVVAKPQFGTLELSTDGKYVYKPSAGYTGTDAFTVKVVSEGSGVNLFNLGGGLGQAAEMTIKVGADGPTHPLSGVLGSGAPVAGSIPPVALFVTAPVSISVDANNKPSITLTVKDGTELTWQRPGANGQVTVADAWKSWDKFTAAAGDPRYVMMGVEFALPNGTPITAIFNSITASGNGDTYTFTGQFATDPTDGTGTAAVDSFYDIIGASYKGSYENFRSRFGGEDDATGKPFNASNLDLDINSAKVYFSNYTLDSYQKALVGTDPGVTVSPPQPGLQAAASNTTIRKSDDVSVIIGDGAGGFYEATKQGKVMHYRAAPPEGKDPLLDLTEGIEWNSPVTTMISYGGRTVPVYGQVASQSESQTVTAGVKTVFFELDKAVDFTKVQAGTMSGSVTYGTEKYAYTVDGGGKFTFTGTAIAGSPNPVSGSVTAQPNGANSLVNITFDKALAAGQASTALSYSVQTGESTVAGLVVGLGDGAVQQWTPGDPTDPAQAGGSWKEIKDAGWQSAVNVLMPYKGRPDVCAGGCDGFLVGLNNGSVQQYNEARNGAGQPGWYELQGSGWGSPVRDIVLSKTDSAGLPTFAVGLQNGAVEQWNNGPTYGWTEIQKPGKNGWNSEIEVMMPYADGFVVGLKNGAVFQRNNDNDTWKQLLGEQYQSRGGMPVTTLVPFGAGFAAGYQDGSVLHWTGEGWKRFKTPGFEVKTMTQYGSIGLAIGTGGCYTGTCTVNDENWNGVLVWDGEDFQKIQKLPGDTGSGWDGTPTAMTQIGNQLIVGLSDGSTQFWDGTKWTALKSRKLSLADGALRDAVEFARSGGKALSGGSFVADPGNIFFAQADQLQPTCVSSSKGCDASFYAFTLKGENPKSLAGKSIALGANGQSLDLSYDVGSTDYGYVMVPNGIWKKLNPEKYAFAVLASIYTGPSVTLNLGPDGVFSTAPVDLINFDYTCNLVCSGGTGTYNVNVNVNAKVEGSLLGADGNPLVDALNGHTYVVPGMVIAYNTGGKAFQFGAGNYIDSDYSDFKKVNGVEVKPIITPSLTLTWGLFTSPNTPIIGEVSLFDLNLGYENPISLDIDIQKGQDPSATVNSTGNITYGAGILDTIFPFLDYQGSLQVYSYTSPNLLVGSAAAAVSV